MAYIIVAICFLLGLGLFFILLDTLKVPTLSVQKAMILATKKEGKTNAFDSHLMLCACKVSRLIRLDPYKKSRLQSILSATGIGITPEVYCANAILKTVLVFLLVIPTLFLFPLLSPIILFLGILVYFKEMKKADEQLKEKRGKIERDLPRFVATITQELKGHRDVLAIIDHFKENANKELSDELHILSADMKSSSYESALIRFQTRINSFMLSDIVRGLISVLRGDDISVYFQMLSHDMKQLELQKLKKQAQKIPSKVKVHSFIMLMCFLLTYLVIIAVVMIQSMKTLF